jgi:prepilin-type N-terminal cleavage/methylation domain-containing protein
MNLAPIGAREGHLRGFTLIELLVVIAIIGILSSVVLASLNTARNKGADAAIKSNLAAARAQAELFYDANGNSYANLCGATAVGGVKTIAASVQAAIDARGGSDTVAAACNATATAWAASVQLKSTTDYYCVDSTGAAATSSTRVITDQACP